MTIEALQRIGKGDSWASNKDKFLYRFYKGKDESDFNNISKITYEWSKAHPPSELLEQLSHFLLTYLKSKECLSNVPANDIAALAFELARGLLFEKLPPRVQKLAVSGEWKASPDFDTLSIENDQ